MIDKDLWVPNTHINDLCVSRVYNKHHNVHFTSHPKTMSQTDLPTYVAAAEAMQQSLCQEETKLKEPFETRRQQLKRSLDELEVEERQAMESVKRRKKEHLHAFKFAEMLKKLNTLDADQWLAVPQRDLGEEGSLVNYILDLLASSDEKIRTWDDVESDPEIKDYDSTSDQQIKAMFGTCYNRLQVHSNEISCILRSQLLPIEHDHVEKDYYLRDVQLPKEIDNGRVDLSKVDFSACPSEDTDVDDLEERYGEADEDDDLCDGGSDGVRVGARLDIPIWIVRLVK